MKHHILVKILYNTPGWTSLGSKFMYTMNKKENYNVFSSTKRDSVFTLLFKDGTEKVYIFLSVANCIVLFHVVLEGRVLKRG